MGKMFDSNGKLNIPLPAKQVKEKKGQLVVSEAYCQNGHSLISDVTIEGEKGLHFIYTNKDGSKETEIVISPVVRKCEKTVLKGEPFEKGETVKILCPVCREELPVLLNCECGAPIYLFFLDDSHDHRIAHSFCSRIGCVKASELRSPGEEIRELMKRQHY